MLGQEGDLSSDGTEETSDHQSDASGDCPNAMTRTRTMGTEFVEDVDGFEAVVVEVVVDWESEEEGLLLVELADDEDRGRRRGGLHTPAPAQQLKV